MPYTKLQSWIAAANSGTNLDNEFNNVYAGLNDLDTIKPDDFLGLTDTPSSYTSQGSKLVKVNSGATALEFSDTFTNQVLHIRDEKASGTAAGTFTSGAWRTRDLNTVKTNTITGASLSSNQFILPAGTYRARGKAPSVGTAGHQAKIRNITDSTDTLIGTPEGSSTAADISSSSIVVGQFTIAGTKTFELQHQCIATRSTDGFGYSVNFSVVVVYSELFIEKVG